MVKPVVQHIDWTTYVNGHGKSYKSEDIVVGPWIVMVVTMDFDGRAAMSVYDRVMGQYP